MQNRYVQSTHSLSKVRIVYYNIKVSPSMVRSYLHAVDVYNVWFCARTKKHGDEATPALQWINHDPLSTTS